MTTLHEVAAMGLFRFLIPVILCAAPNTACTAKQVPQTGLLECVGRLSFNLPGVADVASMTADQFLKNSEERAFQFDDGEAAFYSYFQYGGNVAISAPLTKLEIAKLIVNQREAFAGIQKVVATGEMTAGNSSKLNVQKLNPADSAFGWKLFNSSEVTFIAYPAVAGHAMSWMVSGTAEQGRQIEKDFSTLRLGVRPRPINSVPAEKGVCMPYLFIRDGGDDSAGRIVAATYRLREHPDVTIMLKDSTATGVPSNSRAEQYSAIYQSNFFWTQDYQQAKSVKSLLNGSHNKVKVAGQNAVETMFRIERKDNSEDFGYLVVARGDPMAAVDTPDVMMYVIQNAENAKRKGVVPLTKDAFFAMARSISASVKHRDKK